MSVHLALLIGYSVLLLALGLAVSRRVSSANSFFVADRRLTPLLVFSTVLAANIGAGSTVGATGNGYQYGLSAWWWNGSAGLGSLLLAFWIGPRVWAQASRFGFLTTGDLLEHHFGRTVRAAVTALLWMGMLSIMAGQLIGISGILNVVVGLPMWAGCLISGGLMTAYSAAGGLMGSAWVNLVQLIVLLVGFAIALPATLTHAGGLEAVLNGSKGAGQAGFWGGSASVSFLVLLIPAFMSSPGLLQKSFGARDARAVRLGIGWNGVVLLGFAFVPALLGMTARMFHPSIQHELALPTLLAYDLPVAFGSILLAAIFSAEISTADTVVYMLATSLSQDLYRRFIRPQASDKDVLRVARWAAVLGGGLGILIALVTPTIIGALSVFYAMLGATMFLPVIVALHAKTSRQVEVGVSVVAGVCGVLICYLAGSAPGSLWTPGTVGLLAAVTGYALAVVARKTGTLGSRT